MTCVVAAVRVRDGGPTGAVVRAAAAVMGVFYITLSIAVNVTTGLWVTSRECIWGYRIVELPSGLVLAPVAVAVTMAVTEWRASERRRRQDSMCGQWRTLWLQSGLESQGFTTWKRKRNSHS